MTQRPFGRLLVWESSSGDWEAASPGMRSQPDPARRAAAVLCPGLASLCGRAGVAGGHGPPGQGSSLGHRGVQHT